MVVVMYGIRVAALHPNAIFSSKHQKRVDAQVSG